MAKLDVMAHFAALAIDWDARSVTVTSTEGDKLVMGAEGPTTLEIVCGSGRPRPYDVSEGLDVIDLCPNCEARLNNMMARAQMYLDQRVIDRAYN